MNGYGARRASSNICLQRSFPLLLSGLFSFCGTPPFLLGQVGFLQKERLLSSVEPAEGSLAGVGHTAIPQPMGMARALQLEVWAGQT